MIKIKTILFLIATVAIIIVPSCKKDKDSNTSSKPSLALTKAEYMPGEIALIQANGSFSADTFTAEMDGNRVKVFATDSNRLFFVVPTKSSGSYVLNLNNAEFENQQIALTIGNYTAITDVEAELAQIKSDANKRVAELEGLKSLGMNISDQNISELKVMNTAFENAYTGLTKIEKEELVYFMKNNALFSEPLPAVPFTDSFYRRNFLDDPSDELWKQGKLFAKNMAVLAFKVGVITQLILYPEGLASKTLALGLTIAVAVNVVQLNSILDKIGDLIGLAASFDFSGVKQFVKNKTTTIIDRITFKNLRQSDKGQGNNVDMIIEQTEVYQSKWDKLQAALQKIKSWFSTVPEQLSGTAAKLKSTIKTQVFKVKHSYLSVGQVNNNRIQVNVVDENGERKIQANSDLTEKTNFQFDITYTHPDLGTSITKTIDAEYDPNANNNSGSYIDPRDGKIYKTIKIGNQEWFAENLSYSIGITQVSDQTAWESSEQPAWCNYENNSANDILYGKLYNWYSVKLSNVCPAGWHVPSDADWTTLTDNLGGITVAGGKMKSITGWNSPNTNATNESGFNGLPGGNRAPIFNFHFIGESSDWWSSTEFSQWSARTRGLSHIDGIAYRNYMDKNSGLSVRCVKD